MSFSFKLSLNCFMVLLNLLILYKQKTPTYWLTNNKISKNRKLEIFFGLVCILILI